MSTSPPQHTCRERAVSRSQLVPGNCTTARRGAAATMPLVYGSGRRHDRVLTFRDRSQERHDHVSGAVVDLLGRRPRPIVKEDMSTAPVDLNRYPVDGNGF